MGLTMKERKAVTNELSQRYQRATKKERGQLLRDFMQLTGYNRSYASHLLHNWGTRQIRLVDGKRVEIILGTLPPNGPRHRRRACQYTHEVRNILEKLWTIADGLCGKRLKAFIRTALPVLERCGEIILPDEAMRSKLLSISPATIDRLLAPVKKQVWEKGRSATKPGTLLKHHIPIRTFADWNEKVPGFLEIDLVAHDGGSACGDFLQTLDATDIASCWTETQAVRTKAQVFVLAALRQIQRELPFPLLGIDSDNGGEFINNHLVRFCDLSQITFTRSRPFRKNDSCYVEQKNYSIVRRTTGYYRYDTDEQLFLLREIYRQLRLYTNFFQPVMKLLSKTRIGSRVHKCYDEPRTPYERLLALGVLSPEVKERLTSQFAQLNPAELKRTIATLQTRLFASHSPVPPVLASTQHRLVSPPPTHPWRQTDHRCKNLLPLVSLSTPTTSEIDSQRTIHDTSSHPTQEPHMPP